MGSLSPVHWAIVIVVVLLLFGSRKLPDMARGLGQSMRILKAETRGMQDDDRGRTSSPGEGAPANGDSGSTSAINGPTSERSSGTTGPAAEKERPSSAERDAS
ncbi:Sec-independent protein translocase subunit TatA [Actinomycetospora endophytica]|uniref:Sec-independent protein translocase protein TatA n=1 Tax=Actinomycetospora endophytica TaxID=2291215 RepID=A0ABS8P3M1_9PSEU|nr:Sec-independent protein translocase subunit TatA [Actinomycetospora endophytica]MCD2192694.1 Sec-independent protein translocase subunit TatA [Actinomycetospora endophytica]